MKQLMQSFLVAALVLGLAAATAYAQPDEWVEADIPFTFFAGNTQLPPGTYSIRPLADAPDVMQVTSADGRVSVFLPTEPLRTEQPSDDTYLTFDKVGNRDFLAEIWTGGEVTGSEVVKSHMELNAEKTATQHTRHTLRARHKKAKQAHMN
jgi:hypothetical protein